MKKILYPELSYKITGLCFKVQKALGRFCREKQYCDKFEELLKELKINYQREVEIDNKKINSPSGNKIDFLIDNKIIFEAKAKKFITKEDYNQTLRYLQSADLELGLIVNFRSSYLKPKRVLNSKYSGYSGGNSEHSGRSPGFTLIELIVYFAIISVVSLISVDVLYSISDSRGRIESRSEVNQNLRFAAERLVNDVHLATAITIPADTNQSGNVLTITLPSEGSVSYSVSGGVLQRNSVNITSNNVTVGTASSIFTRINNGNNKTIQVNLRISYNDAGRPNWQYANSVQTTAAVK